MFIEGEEQRTIDYEKALNPEQYEAVTALEGPVLVVAGAGSGKTRVITYRVANLVESGVPPEKIVLLTFTRRAASEMLNRAQNLTGIQCSRVHGGTFHSFSHFLLRRYGEAMGLDRRFTVMDEGDSQDAVKLVRDRLQLGEGDRRFPNKITLFNIISKSHNKMRPIEEIVFEECPHFKEEIPSIQLLAQHYEKLKRERNLVDFDDLLELCCDLLDSPTGLQISSNYLYIMADEYQDTNLKQAEIVKLLSRGHGNIFVVGDDAQCIYTWRGSDFRNINRFADEFPGVRVIKLERNYRSTQPILDLANQVMSGAFNTYTKVLRAVHPEGELPYVVDLTTVKQQAKFISKKILSLHEEGIKLGEIAVLARAVWHLRDLEIALNQANIPYIVYGGIRFTEAAHIKDVLAYIKAAFNPDDDLSWKRILELAPGIGPATSRRLTESLQKSPESWKTLQEQSKKVSPKARQIIKQMSEAFRRISEDKLRPSEITGIIKEVYTPVLKRKFDDYPRRMKDLEQLITIAAPYRSIHSFVTDMALEPSRDRSRNRLASRESNEDHLVLSTVHSAKGLEFQSVFIPHLLDGLFPSARSFENPEALEEERRLFYVAVTRAKTDLYLCVPMFVPGLNWMGVELGMDKNSRFLDSYTDDFVKRIMGK